MTMTLRSDRAGVVRGIGAVAIAVLVLAWMLGATALTILGLGLGLAALAARAWTWLVPRGLEVERCPAAVPTEEGQPLRLEVVVRGSSWLASGVELIDRVGPLGEQRVAVGRGGHATIWLPACPRGRYPLGPGRLVVDDPLALTRVELPVAEGGTILVRPRVPHLPALFSDAGGSGGGGRRRPRVRPSGLEPHGVREYVEGEPLRAVHWASSARRGRLMVRELEDAPRDSVAIVLDVERSANAGAAGDSSLDDAVRAAAGLLRAHASRERGALLAIATPIPWCHRVDDLGPSFEVALDALAAVEPADAPPLSQLVGAGGPLGSVAELVLVTSRPDRAADELVVRASGPGLCALVVVDSPTYAGRPPSPPSPTLLRLAAAGVAIAVVRHGGLLEETLAGLEARAVG